jgi:Protein of unknown function (DUF3617)
MRRGQSRIGCAATAAIALVGVASPAALAEDQDYPPLKQGMWEVSRTIQLADKPEQAKTLTNKRCVDPVEELKKQHAMLKNLGCLLLPPKQAGDIYSFKWECNNDALRGTGQTVVTVDGDSVYTAKTDSDGALPGRPGRSVEQLVAKRLGDCTG